MSEEQILLLSKFYVDKLRTIIRQKRMKVKRIKTNPTRNNTDFKYDPTIDGMDLFPML